jgi:DNA helicase-2/ATP-dependent DNA helicase PcrA
MGFFQKEPPRLNYFSPYLVQTNKTKPTSWINYDGFFQKGDKVKHQILGLGVVETIMQDLIQVRFVDSQKLKIFENKTAFLAKIKK